MYRSRLRQSREKKTKKELFLLTAIIIGLLIVLIKYGIPALINLSLMTSKQKDEQLSKSSSGPSYVAPPDLDQSFTATNTAQIKVTGSATSGEKIKLYVNNILSDSTDTNNSGNFTFDTVSLHTGDNEIKAVAVKDSSESNSSDAIHITYQNKAPTLSIDYPPENDTIKGDRSIIVNGKTDPGMSVTVNGSYALVKYDGSYSTSINLQDGDNTITVISQDTVGNQTKIDRKVTYSP